MIPRTIKAVAVFLLGTAVCPLATYGKPIEGFTQPFETVNLAAPEAGIIQELLVRQGETVTAKQPIALLDNQVLYATLESARAKAASRGPVQAAEAAFRQRQSRLNHMRQLRQEGHGSPEEVERAESDAEIAKANLVSAREDARANALEVKRIEAQIERRTIRSPIHGVISYIAKRPGEFATATDPTVATIVQIDKLRVIFHVPTEQLAGMRVRDHVKVRFTSSGRETTALVDFISPVTDAESNLVRVEVIIDNSDGHFRSGVRCVMSEQLPDSQAQTARVVDEATSPDSAVRAKDSLSRPLPGKSFIERSIDRQTYYRQKPNKTRVFENVRIQ